MKTKILILAALMFASQLFAQRSNIILFTEQGEQFTAILNGVKQNPKPETNVKITDLNANSYKLKVIFADQSLGVMDKNLYLEPGTERAFNIKLNKKGQYVLRMISEVPLASAPPPAPNQAVIVYHAEPLPVTEVTITETTTTTTTTENQGGNTGGDNVSIGINVSEDGVGFNMNVNVGAEGTNTGTDEGTITTSTTVTTGHPPGCTCHHCTSAGTTTGGDVAGNKVTICHIPPGNPSMAHTLSISRNALESHLAHGDYVGSCGKPATGVNPAFGGTISTTITTTTTEETAPPHEHVYVLPGYNGPVGCPLPMTDNDFRNAKNSIASKSFSDSKLTIARQVTSSNCLLSSQVKEIMLLFDFEDTRIKYAKYAYGYTYDLGNYYKVNDAFDFESSIEELNEYINSR
ncbi:MAG: DUF4476 domain-containing protein [Cytophagales bacterium]|nr:DUF4476 domain-containing protein [Cytophagales bacterium]